MAVQALVHPERITVLGSSSLLATAPELGEAGQPLELSFDADLMIQPSDEEMAAIVHEALGEGSLYHRRNAVFADLLRPDIVETLPDRWAEHLVPLPDCPNTMCLDPHDLALVKLSLGREKDMELMKHLLARGLLREEVLRQRFLGLTWNEHRLKETGRRMSLLIENNKTGRPPTS